MLGGGGGLLTMGTTLLAPALYIWKRGFLASLGLWVARSPLAPWGGCFLDAVPPSTPKCNSYNSAFVFCRNIALALRCTGEGASPHALLLQHHQQGNLAREKSQQSLCSEAAG